MEASQLFLLKKKIEGLEIGGYILSSSHPGESHLVQMKDGKWTCDCHAGYMGKDCTHKKQMVQKIINIANDNKTIR